MIWNVIGDIHNCAAALDELLRRFEEMGPPTATYVFLGDLIGPPPGRPSEVIERVVRHADEHQTVLLSGNHEAYAADFLFNTWNGRFVWDWQDHGQLNFLRSYGYAGSGIPASAAAAREEGFSMPEAHERLLRNLQPILAPEASPFVFVHAGLVPAFGLEDPNNHEPRAHPIWRQTRVAGRLLRRHDERRY